MRKFQGAKVNIGAVVCAQLPGRVCRRSAPYTQTWRSSNQVHTKLSSEFSFTYFLNLIKLNISRIKRRRRLNFDD